MFWIYERFECNQEIGNLPCCEMSQSLFSLPRIYEEFNHTVANADYEKDLKWWSNNHGVNMPMNWPSFEV